MTSSQSHPLVLITGATGNLGRSLAAALARDYQVVGLDRSAKSADFPVFEADFTSADSVRQALGALRARFGDAIASVMHLVAFFDFSGEDNPLYRSVNVEGTRHLLQGLQDFRVQQFLYAGTMLVHAPCDPGERIDESQPIGPRWAYPRSKAETEEVIRAEHGAIPYAILRLAGVYDEQSMVPTLAHQMARIYERDFQSYFYSGDTRVGQTMLHRQDMIDAFRRTVDRREALPPAAEILVGEPEPLGYDDLQDTIGRLIHGDKDWPTLRLPKPVAAAGAWVQDKLEPVIPDAIDQGQEPFIKPFMVRMADDHYALDISRARQWLGWEPRHRLREVLPTMVEALKRDPNGWYKANGVPAPAWMSQAQAEGCDPEQLRARHARQVRTEHSATRWAHFANIGLGTWLVTQPVLVGVAEPLLRWSEISLGLALVVFASMALSWKAQWARWVCAGIGLLVMAAPFVFWTGSAAAYLSDTLVGGLIFGFAVCTRPEPGPSAMAVLSGPDVPPGWDYNPSAWSQRIPIIGLALVGLYVSRYLAAYQLEHVSGVWEPFFAGSPEDPRNGTEEIITSSVSEAFPVSDAALGGWVYMIEIVSGIVGTRARWRTMPWLVLLFGLLIAPLGVTSILFIIIQPVVIGTWSTLALIGAAAMLVQIPYALDEMLATLQFLRRRARAGQSWLRVLFVGDTDDMSDAAGRQRPDEFERSPAAVVREMLVGGVNLPWNLVLAGLLGAFLLFTRLALGAEGNLAHVHHVVGALVLTVLSLAAAEVARPLRYLNLPLAAVLVAAPFVVEATTVQTVVTVGVGVGIAVLSLRRGPIRGRYAGWDRLIV